jgi:peptidyl-prolyl cis-trans isomerase D
MRGAAHTWAIKVLLVFLVVSFAIWGVGDMFRGNPQQRTVACVGGFYLSLGFLFGSSAAICTGERITVENLQAEFQRNYEMARQKMGPDFTQKIARQLGYTDSALKDIIDRKLFDHAVTESALQFDDAFVLREIGSMSGMHTPDGKFNTEVFRQAVNKMHMTEQEFIDYTRQTAQRSMVMSSLAGIATPPKTAIDAITAAQGLERHIQVLRLAHDALPIATAPSDADIGKYYVGHAPQFTAPEYRSLSIMEMMVDDISKNTVIADADIAIAFKKRHAEFAQPERRDLVQVMLPDEAKAAQIVAAAQASKNLKQLAMAQNLKPVVMEDQTEQNILPALYTSVFTADEGAIIGPVKTEFGWHVLQLNKIKASTEPTLAAFKDKLREQLQHEHAAESIQDLANKVDDDLAGGKNLEEIAATYKFKIIKFSNIDAAGNTEYGKSANLPMSDVTLKNAFGLNEGESSGLLDDRKGNYMVLHLDKVTPSRIRALADIKDKVIAAWIADQQIQAAATEAAKMAETWRHHADALSELTKQRGVSVLAMQQVSILTGFGKDLPRAMQQEIFALNPGETAVGADADAHYIVRLAAYKALDPTKNAAAQTNLKSKLANDWREGMLDEYEKALEQHTPAQINQILLEEIQATSHAND